MNPARPSHMLVGVGTEELGMLYAQVFKLKAVERVLVSSDLHTLGNSLILRSYLTILLPFTPVDCAFLRWTR